VEFITGGDRRRVWAAEQKRGTALESLDPSTTPTDVGCRGRVPYALLGSRPTPRPAGRACPEWEGRKQRQLAPDHARRMRERQPVRVLAGPQRRVAREPTHSQTRQQQAPDLLARQTWRWPRPPPVSHHARLDAADNDSSELRPTAAYRKVTGGDPQVGETRDGVAAAGRLQAPVRPHALSGRDG